MAEQHRPRGEHYPPRERKDDLPAFHRSARFTGESPAGLAYQQAQEALYSGPPNDLSTFRLLLNDAWYVAVLGQEPPQSLHDQLTTLLASGEPADLPPALWQALNLRRKQAIRQAPWVERHYRR
jgi:hypothetical protein